MRIFDKPEERGPEREGVDHYEQHTHVDKRLQMKKRFFIYFFGVFLSPFVYIRRRNPVSHKVFLRCVATNPWWSLVEPPQRPSAGAMGQHQRFFARNISSPIGAIKKNNKWITLVLSYLSIVLVLSVLDSCWRSMNNKTGKNEVKLK